MSGPTNSGTKDVLVAVLSGDEDTQPLLDNMAAASSLHFDLVTFDGSLSNLVSKLGTRSQKLERLEIVAHGLPYEFGPFDLNNLDTLVTWLSTNCKSDGAVILSGCNTGTCQDGASIIDKLAAICPQKVYGCLGYLEPDKGIYSFMTPKVTRVQTDEAPVFCGSKEETGLSGYRHAKSDAVAAQMRLRNSVTDFIDLSNLLGSSGQNVGSIIASILIASLARPPLSGIRIHPLVAPDIRAKFVSNGTTRKVSIYYDGAFVRDWNTKAIFAVQDVATLSGQLRKEVLAIDHGPSAHPPALAVIDSNGIRPKHIPIL